MMGEWVLMEAPVQDCCCLWLLYCMLQELLVISGITKRLVETILNENVGICVAIILDKICISYSKVLKFLKVQFH